MNKRRLFVAYCSEQHPLAQRYKDALSESFEVVLWGEAQSPGESVLESTIKAMRSCSYGLALLSCDDLAQSGKEGCYQPRDNVVLEVGLMLGLYGKDRTAIVSVQAPSGEWPKVPTDYTGILHHKASHAKLNTVEAGSMNDSAQIQALCHEIRNHLLDRDPDFIPSCSTSLAEGHGFNVLTMPNAITFWLNFQGEFFSINPSWQLEHDDDDWLHSHYVRYMSPDFGPASYVIDIDRGRAPETMETNIEKRKIEQMRDLSGICSFVERLEKKYPDVKKNLQEKMKVFLRPGIRSELSSFIGRINSLERAFLFIRQLNNEVVLESRSKAMVATLKMRTRQLIRGYDSFTPADLEDLRKRLVGK